MPPWGSMATAEAEPSRRSNAASAGRAYVAGTMTWRAFIDEFGEKPDPLIAELVDLVEHEPKQGGFLGANARNWAVYCQQREAAIARLETDA